MNSATVCLFLVASQVSCAPTVSSGSKLPSLAMENSTSPFMNESIHGEAGVSSKPRSCKPSDVVNSETVEDFYKAWPAVMIGGQIRATKHIHAIEPGKTELIDVLERAGRPLLNAKIVEWHQFPDVIVNGKIVTRAMWEDSFMLQAGDLILVPSYVIVPE